jgi:hypothetical protein
MDIIEQKLVVKDWPLKQPGDEMFFGYVVALGVFPRDWTLEGEIPFADFAYNNDYTRYRIPCDESLLNGLLKFLSANLTMCGDVGMHGKVWIELTKEGHKVYLP